MTDYLNFAKSPGIMIIILLVGLFFALVFLEIGERRFGMLILGVLVVSIIIIGFLSFQKIRDSIKKALIRKNYFVP